MGTSFLSTAPRTLPHLQACLGRASCLLFAGGQAIPKLLPIKSSPAFHGVSVPEGFLHISSTAIPKAGQMVDSAMSPPPTTSLHIESGRRGSQHFLYSYPNLVRGSCWEGGASLPTGVQSASMQRLELRTPNGSELPVRPLPNPGSKMIRSKGRRLL